MLPNKNGEIILEKKQLAMIMNNFFVAITKDLNFILLEKKF